MAVPMDLPDRPLASPRARFATQPAIPAPVLAVALLIAAEVMLFAGLVAALLVLRGKAPQWPPPGMPPLPVAVTAMNTLILLASGWTATVANRAVRQGERGRSSQAIGWTLALGVVFLGVQAFEWARLLAHGLRADRSTYAAVFYALVGAHAAHVAGALAVGAWVGWRWARGRLGPIGVRAMLAFWYFVVGLWPLLFALVYLW